MSGAAKEDLRLQDAVLETVDRNPSFAYLIIWEVAMDIKDKVFSVLERIEKAGSRCGLNNKVALLAAVKDRESFEIKEVLKAGINFLGENRIQEGEKHFAALPEARDSFNFHFIGRLQSNKAKKAVRLFDSIDSVDSQELVLKLEKAAEEQEVFRNVMIEVNMGEEQKGGVKLQALSGLCDVIHKSPHLTLTGLMGVPPFFEEAEKSRLFFKKLYKLFEEAKKNHPSPGAFVHLSMGMSNDFEVAIEEGSTMVRIGTLIFGPRR